MIIPVHVIIADTASNHVIKYNIHVTEQQYNDILVAKSEQQYIKIIDDLISSNRDMAKNVKTGCFGKSPLFCKNTPCKVVNILWIADIFGMQIFDYHMRCCQNCSGHICELAKAYTINFIHKSPYELSPIHYECGTTLRMCI